MVNIQKHLELINSIAKQSLKNIMTSKWMAFTFNINIIIVTFIVMVRNYIKIITVTTIIAIIKIMAIINSLELLLN